LIILSATYKDGTTEVLATSDEREVTLPKVYSPMGILPAPQKHVRSSALKDYNKAKTVVLPPRGKGVMQQSLRLSDGSALDLTVANYNPPTTQNFVTVWVLSPTNMRQIDPELDSLIEYLDTNTDLQLKKGHWNLQWPPPRLSRPITRRYPPMLPLSPPRAIFQRCRIH
jgi:carboxyl-terminal processing protease